MDWIKDNLPRTEPMLTSQTIRVMGNLAKISNRLEFIPGKELRAMTPMRNIFAVAELNQTIPKAFAINDMKEFLRVVRLNLKEDKQTAISWDDGGTESDNVLDQVGRYPAIIMKNCRATTTYLTDEVRDETLYQKNIMLEEKDIKIRFVLSPVIMRDFREKAEKMRLKDFLITDKELKVFNRWGVGNQTRMTIPMMDNEGVEALFSVSNLKHLLNLYY